jgi:nicotinamide riboside kinase
MKIAITGSSSTGKTTLAISLLNENRFHKYATNFLSADARSLLIKGGFKNMDNMTTRQTMMFQTQYFYRKKKIENEQSNFITDRSFIDIAAYWFIRDSINEPRKIQNKLIDLCKIENQKYDFLIYLPFGLIEFENDGYRSKNLDFHRTIDNQIKIFLEQWNTNYIALNTNILTQRINTVLEYLELAYG